MRNVGILLILLLATLATKEGVVLSQQGTGPDPRFGITEAFWVPEEAAELGVGWERILFYWRELQPTGPDDWNTLHVREEWIAQANASGRTIVGLLKNTAPWASADGTEAGVPIGLDLPVDDPDNLWAGLLRRVARYYGARNVHHWIIWNEPEIKRGVYGYEFAGSVEDYYRLVKVAYQVLKQEDPQAVIHLAGLTWWHDESFLERFLNIVTSDPEAAENEHFFDVLSLHIYFRAESVRRIVEEVQTIQGRFGLTKPIWINETNASPNLDPLWPVERPVFPVDLDQQAWFIIQAVALGFASGAERVGVYKLLDIQLPPGGESFGILRPDMSRRPAFEAYENAIRMLSGFTTVSLQQSETFFSVAFYRPGHLTRVLWSRVTGNQVVAVPVANEAARLVDALGSSSLVISPGGYHRLELKGARCGSECIIGGEPIFLAEELSIPPAFDSLVTVPVDQVPSEALNTATPTPTATITPTPTSSPTPTPTKPPTATPSPTSVLDASSTPIPEATANTANVDETMSPTTEGSAVVPLDEKGVDRSAQLVAGLFSTAAVTILLAAIFVSRSRNR